MGPPVRLNGKHSSRCDLLDAFDSYFDKGSFKITRSPPGGDSQNGFIFDL